MKIDRSFVSDITSNPDADFPRLAYADWLEENGKKDRADCIRFMVEHPDWGPTRVIGSPISLSDTPVRWGVEVAELGQHTEEVLVEFGLTWDEIGQLRDEGAL